MNTTSVKKTLDKFASVNPTLDNQTDIITFKGFTPTQSNTNIDEETKKVAWGQLMAVYKSSYSRIDERTGESISDNATLCTLKVKFPRLYLEEHGVTSSEFKHFFDTYIVNKHRLVVPTTEEKQSFKNKQPILNATECAIHASFDLRAFIEQIQNESRQKREVKQ